MATSQVSIILLALLALIASTSAIPTIYEIVKQFGFPAGIVPDSVESYTTNDVDGTFAIYLKKPCYVKYEYLVYFDTEITGKISYGLITDITGLQAQSYGIWLDIDEIKVVGDNLQFTLGFITVKSDIALFEEIPTCKDKALSACTDRSSKLISQLPIIVE
ncbi:uncharacterized protein At5g01610-like [Bidens hawaiensis]|uniref:uncharacterized protein At5g01610-like n=1 Tax=Bidens hawaiensis TaxID=980011 RepID=UPI0040493C4E